MSYEYNDVNPVTPKQNPDTTEAENHEVLLACLYQNPFMCGVGSATPYQGQQLERTPRYVPPEGVLQNAEQSGSGITLRNPYADSGDSLSNGTDLFLKKYFDTEKTYRGNREVNLVKDFRVKTAFGQASDYAMLTKVATAAGEATLGRGSQIPYLSLDVQDPNYPKYVLTDKGYYDLGATALDYLYTGAAALKDLGHQPRVDQNSLTTQDKRINWDIDKVLGSHNMDQVLNELAGPDYKDYGNRYVAWKENCIDKYNHPENHIFDIRALDSVSIAKYQAKAVRDAALIDMALIKNNAGDRQKLAEEVNLYLGRAAQSEPNNTDLIELQKLAAKL